LTNLPITRTCSACRKQKLIREFATAAGQGLCKTCKRKGWWGPEYIEKEVDRAAKVGPIQYPPDAYQRKEMREILGDQCWICGMTPDYLFTDHDHKTGWCRGRLCRHCNTGLGFFKDKLLLLQRAVEYMKNPPWPQGGKRPRTRGDSALDERLFQQPF
jgi:hypothetical protein